MRGKKKLKKKKDTLKANNKRRTYTATSDQKINLVFFIGEKYLFFIYSDGKKKLFI